jgi:hypothetical protein
MSRCTADRPPPEEAEAHSPSASLLEQVQVQSRVEVPEQAGEQVRQLAAATEQAAFQASHRAIWIPAFLQRAQEVAAPLQRAASGPTRAEWPQKIAQLRLPITRTSWKAPSGW